MIQGLIGKKMGMTQVFAEDGRVLPVTCIAAGPCLVVQTRKIGEDLSKVQLGYVERRKIKHVNKPMQGHFAKANVPPTRLLREFFARKSDLKVGDSVKVDIFAEKERVNVIGTIKGKGFQGVVKRHGFTGGRASHGSMMGRRPGSMGCTTYPGRVIKGKKLPGHMGNVRMTVKGLEVVKVDVERNLLLVCGAVPGCRGASVLIMKDSFVRS